MSITAGTRLGPYEVVAQLGAGGMGEVWRAVDTRLGREAAIKILPEISAADPEALVRFRREAQILATFDHPNIARIYSFEAVGDRQVLAMELVPGETLAEMMGGKALSVPEALAVARQVAAALETAHANGILHRDLKPANVKVTPSGAVKLLDFGLGKSFIPAGNAQDLTSSPTIESGNTREGTVVGTFSYMSPEQTRGKPLDRRTDIWSFGCLLFEMLTGKKAFGGETMADTFAAILHKPVDLERLPGKTPRAVVKLVEECLEKTAENRAPDMGYVRQKLEEAGDATQRIRALVPRLSRRSRATLLAGVAVVVVAAAGWLALRGRKGSALPETKLLAILPAADLTGRPDGRLLSDGVSASLRVKLQRVHGLQVLAASSTALAHDTEPMHWARDTGANLLVQPTVRQTGDTLQLSYTLTRPASPVQLAADEVVGPAAEPFRLEEELAAKLLRALEVGVVAARTDAVVAGRAQLDYILASGYLERWDDPDSVAKGIELLSTIPRAEDSALVQAALGRAYLRQYELSKDIGSAVLAKQAAERAISLDAELPEALLTLGRVLTATGKPKEAIEPLRKALAKQPGYAEAELALAKSLNAAGDRAEAEAAYRRATDLQPTSWTAFNALASFYFRSDRYEDAVATYTKAASLNPEVPSVQLNLGAALFRLARYPEAADAFRRSIAIRPTATAWSNLGTLEYAQGHYPEAVTAFESAVKMSPANYTLWMNLGDGLTRVPARAGEAAAAYEESVRLARADLAINAASGKARAVIAVALARGGKADAAAAEARKAAELDSRDPNVLLLCARVAALGGRAADALALLEKGVETGLSPREIETEPDFAGLKTDVRYSKLMQHNH